MSAISSQSVEKKTTDEVESEKDRITRCTHAHYERLLLLL